MQRLQKRKGLPRKLPRPNIKRIWIVCLSVHILRIVHHHVKALHLNQILQKDVFLVVFNAQKEQIAVALMYQKIKSVKDLAALGCAQKNQIATSVKEEKVLAENAAPEFVILDEPFSGQLIPINSKQVRIYMALCHTH